MHFNFVFSFLVFILIFIKLRFFVNFVAVQPLTTLDSTFLGSSTILFAVSFLIIYLKFLRVLINKPCYSIWKFWLECLLINFPFEIYNNCLNVQFFMNTWKDFWIMLASAINKNALDQMLWDTKKRSPRFQSAFKTFRISRVTAVCWFMQKSLSFERERLGEKTSLSKKDWTLK